jgi:hypothetical protein
MKAFTSGSLALLFAMLPACGQQLVEFPADGDKPDAAQADLVIHDGPIPDAPPNDGRDIDVRLGDAGVSDSEKRDAGRAEAVRIDTASLDLPGIDAPVVDARIIDAPTTDTAAADTESTDGTAREPAIVINLGWAAPFAIAATAASGVFVPGNGRPLQGNGTFDRKDGGNSVVRD